MTRKKDDLEFQESPQDTQQESIQESIEDQLERLTKALAKHPEVTGFESAREQTEEEADEILISQIVEDQALQAQEAQDAQETQESSQELSAVEDPHEPSAPEEPPLDQENLDLEELQSSIEALLFMSDKPMSAERLRDLLGPTYDLFLFEEAVQNLAKRYAEKHHGIEVIEINGGFQFRTKLGKADLARKLVKVQTQRLSSGAMETLAIIAYRQPAMKEDIDQVRGVDSSYFIRNLLDRKMIKIDGRSELPGKPMLYSTTTEFLEIFGLKDLSALPSLRELEQMVPASEIDEEEKDPRVREMRRMVNEMTTSKESVLHYDPDEDEKILKDIRERVTAIPTSTPSLDELQEKAKQEKLELLNQQKLAQEAQQTGAQEVLPTEPTPQSVDR